MDVWWMFVFHYAFTDSIINARAKVFALEMLIAARDCMLQGGFMIHRIWMVLAFLGLTGSLAACPDGGGDKPLPSKGSLTVTITGAPSGSSPNVNITGPNSFSRTVYATTTIPNLELGTYSLNAEKLVVNGADYNPTVTGLPATVTANQTTNVTVDYYSAFWTAAGFGGAPNGWYVGDFNGDGKKDIFRVLPNVSGADVFLSTGLSFTSLGSWSGFGYGDARDGWYVGDFNGDGKDDIFRVLFGVSGADVFLSNGTSFVASGSWSAAGIGSAPNGWYVGDFNGDGKDDIFRTLPGVSGADVFLSTGSSFSSVGSWTGAGYGAARDGWYVGDFNGDGKDDIFRYCPASTPCGAVTSGAEVFTSTGAGFQSQGSWTDAGAGAAPNGWYIGDFNGDGKDDIFRALVGISGADVFLSNGTSFAYSGSWTAAGYGAARDGWYVGDFSGDNKADLFRYIPQSFEAQVFLSTGTLFSVTRSK
jgi:hypothetical protein